MDETKQHETDRSERKETTSGAFLPEFARQHPTLLATGALALLFVIKIMSVTRGNSTTAAGLVSSAGLVAVALGVAVSVFPTVLLYLVINIFLYLFDVLRRIKTVRIWHQSFVFILIFAIYYLTLWMWLAAAGIALLLAGLAWGYSRWKGEKKPLVMELYVVVVLVVMFLFRDNSLWLPPERIETETRSVSGGDAITGYVISQSEGWTTILREDDRSILRVQSTEITERIICDLGHYEGRTLFELLEAVEEPSYPNCLEDKRVKRP